MYKIKNTKPTNYGVNIRIADDECPNETISVYRSFNAEAGNITHSKARELAEWVEGKLNAPLLSAAMPDEIDVTEPTFGIGFTAGLISGSVVTFVITALVYLFCNHFK